jgi:hypothetical protein
MKTRKRRKKTRRIGSSLVLGLIISLAVGSGGEKKHKAPEAYGIVGGTVFRESGYALPGAEVVITPDPQPGQTPVKIDRPRAISDNRGEFAFRVPVTPMHYKVKAEMKGFEAQEKAVDVEGEQRVDVTLILPSVSK